MPVYLYRHPKTGKIREIVQSVNDKHEFIDEKGIKWEREYTVPTASIDSQNDPFDHKRNLQKIANSKGTIGNMQDFAAEQSQKRADKVGDVDPVKKENWKTYEKTRGKKCLEERKHTLKKALKDSIAKVKSKLPD